MCWFLALASIWAGNVGKLAGRVTDKETGETLPGANILITHLYSGETEIALDPKLGSASTMSGEYFVINVQPGVYKVECGMIGFQKHGVRKVEIVSDRTTTLNFVLESEALDVGKEIIVSASKDIVIKDLTSSRSVTSSAEIKELPVESVTGLMAIQAGIIQDADGALHVRGGRSNELGYYINGMSVADPYTTNGQGVSIANNAIQEMSVVSGTFNAEYGNAMSGIVNITTKEGNNRPEFSLSLYTGDILTSNDDVYFFQSGIKEGKLSDHSSNSFEPFNTMTIEGTLGGPIPFLSSHKLKFFTSFRYDDDHGYLLGIRQHLPSDTSIYMTGGDGKEIKMNWSKALNFTSDLTYQFSPSIKLKGDFIYNGGESQSYSHWYKYNPDGRPKYYHTSLSLAFTLVHNLSPSTFYNLGLSHTIMEDESYTYENPYDSSYVAVEDGTYNSTNNDGWIGGARFFSFGGQDLDHSYMDSKTLTGKFDLTSQISNRHMVKTGVELRLPELDYEAYTILYNKSDYRQPTVLPADSGRTHNVYKKDPQQFSAYFQDKIEYPEMIMNIGLRYDYFNSNSEYHTDILQPDGIRDNAEAKQMLAPRLGVSFPITDQGIIHFSYGHFYQMPSMSAMYVNAEYELPAIGTYSFGNANLDPQKTVIYEIGLQQQIGKSLALDVTGFYKDIRDLLALQTITFRDVSGRIRDYQVYVNDDYGNTKGITLSLSKMRLDQEWISASLDYTFQVAEGNSTDGDAFFFNSLSGYVMEKEIVPLDWDLTHSLNAQVSLMHKSFGLSVIGKLNSGLPYSPEIPYERFDVKTNSGRKPIYKNLDMQASYIWKFSGMSMKYFFKIFNIFDFKNERYVYGDTGRASYTYYDRSQSEPTALKNEYGKVGVQTYDDYSKRPTYFYPPREIRLGIMFEY